MDLEHCRSLAEARNIIIPQMIADGSFYVPADPTQTQKDREGLGKYFSGFRVHGKRNIREAERLVAAGETVILASNHINELDIIARRMALEKYKFDKFINDATYPCELEWFEDPRKAEWMGADSVIKIVPALEMRDAQEAKAQSVPGSEDEELFKIYIDNARKLYEVYAIELQKHNPWAIYPETDFQRIGWGIRPPKEVSGFFPRNGTYVLPVLTIGQEGLPVLVEGADLDTAEPVEITSIAGRLYPTSIVWKNRPAGATPADLVMTSIFRLDPTFDQNNPQYVHPDHVEFYHRANSEVGHFFQMPQAA